MNIKFEDINLRALSYRRLRQDILNHIIGTINS